MTAKTIPQNASNQNAPEGTPAPIEARVLVTPLRAVDWLHTGADNRRLNQIWIHQMARAMNAGQWQYNGEPLRFDVDGQLIDGQHRLWAVVESEKTIEFLVIKNLPRATIFVTDTGKARSLSHFLQMKGEPDAFNMAGSVTSHHRWLASGMYDVLPPSLRASMQDLITVYEDWGPDLKKNFSQARLFRRFGHGGLWASLLYHFGQLSDEDMKDFVHKFHTLSGMEENHPILRLRLRIENARTPRRGISQFDLAPIAIKAWNAYRRGDPIEKLHFQRGGARPEIYPVAI